MNEKKEKMTPTSHRQGVLVDLVDTFHALMETRHDENLMEKTADFSEIKYNTEVIEKILGLLHELSIFDITKIGDLYLTSGNRIVLDKGYGEYFNDSDKKMFSLEELKQGIPYDVFLKKIQEKGIK